MGYLTESNFQTCSDIRNCEWEIIPDVSPQIIRNCSKCGCKSNYINTGSFRVNANGNRVDVWLIYQCSKCKTTYNITIYERISPKKIPREEYEGFLANDPQLALEYSFNSNILKREKAEICMEDGAYHIRERILTDAEEAEMSRIVIRNSYHIRIRLDKLIAGKLDISRTAVRQAMKEKIIEGRDGESLEKAFAMDGMVVRWK